MNPVRLALFLCIASTAPLTTLASPTISCHCFKDREFDPSRPAAADAYLLATTENSLLAGAFGLSKGGVVRARMTGTSREDLWVAHAVAQTSNRSADDLIEARQQTANWKEALAKVGVGPTRLPPMLASRLAAGGDDEALTRLVVDEVLVSKLGATPQLVAALHTLGASDRETAAAVLLTRVATDHNGLETYGRVKAGATSWSASFHALGLSPKEVGEKIGALAASTTP